MRDMAGTLDKIAASMTRGYAARSGKPEAEIAALLAAETWLSAAEALEAGLATRLAEPVRIAAAFDIRQFRNAPPELVEAVEMVESEDTAPATDILADDNDVATDPAPGTPGDAAPDPGATSGPESVPQSDPHVPDRNMPPRTAGASTAPDASAIRAEAIAHARAVIDLCRLAGLPQMAGRFLEDDKTLDDVRAALLDAKADTEPEITPHHPQPGRSSAASPWGEIVARTFKRRG
jgi:hypothetical protein